MGVKLSYGQQTKKEKSNEFVSEQSLFIEDPG